jgi:hypothetical protein
MCRGKGRKEFAPKAERRTSQSQSPSGAASYGNRWAAGACHRARRPRAPRVTRRIGAARRPAGAKYAGSRTIAGGVVRSRVRSSRRRIRKTRLPRPRETTGRTAEIHRIPAWKRVNDGGQAPRGAVPLAPTDGPPRALHRETADSSDAGRDSSRATSCCQSLDGHFQRPTPQARTSGDARL